MRKGRIYALDATAIDICLEVFWWAKFRKTKTEIKLYTLLDLETAIPEYIFISDGSVHEVNTLDYFKLTPGSYLIMDRGYLDFVRLRILAQQRTNFIMRVKDNMKYRVINQRVIDKSKGIVSIQQ